MSSNWGIKTDDGYVNFIHGTIDKVWDFETSSSIDDIVIFSERAAKGYAKAIKANAIQISISEKPQLTIPKSIADEFDQIYEDTEEYQTNVAQMFSSMQHYFDLESYPEILHWLEDDVKNTNVVLAYLAGKALGVDLVKVVEG